MRKILSFVAAMLIAFAANATTWNITPTHCHEGDRTDGYTLYVTLARGAQAGDTIVLADGTYLEGQSMPINNAVVIKAAEGANPVIQMSGYFQVHASAEFEGLKFKFVGEASNGYCMYFYENTSKYLKLEGCEFQDFTQYCVSSWEDYHIDSCIVNNCYFHDLAKAPFYFAASSLENNVNACDKLKVTNSTFANIAVVGYVAVLDIRNNSGNVTGATSKLEVDHCTFYNCQGDYERMIQSYKSPDATVSNCIMMNPLVEGKTEIYATYLYGGSIHHNLNYQTKRQYGSGVTVTDSIQRDPLFVNAATLDLHLGEGSPALGAGSDGSNLGDPRWWPAPAPIEPQMKTIYCKMDKAWWTADGAAVACYTWNDGGEPKAAWPGERMTPVEGEDGLWSIELDMNTYHMCIFTRVNGSGDIADWGAKSGDLVIPTDDNDMYTITSETAVWGDPGVTGTWSKYEPAQPILGTHFVKVTEAPADWAGEYLIVFETADTAHASVAMNGGLAAFDVVSNGVAVSIEDNKIAVSEALLAAKFTIAAMNGGYSIKGASGKFIGAASYANSLLSSDTAIANVLSIADNKAVIAVNVMNQGNPAQVTMRYNYAKDQLRFRYYKSGQQPVALYKLTTIAPEPPQPEVNYSLKNNWDAAADWTWKEMTKDGDNYKLENVVFGGTGVNYKSNLLGAPELWVPMADFLGDTIAAKDTVTFVLNPADSTITATLIGKYIEPAPQPAGLKAVSDSTTWDFAKVKAKTTSPLYSSSKEGILLTAETTPRITDEVIYADYDTTVLTIAAGFDAEAIAFTGEYPIRKDKYCMNGAVHFKAAVAGNIIVKFSDTGTSASATAVKRYLMVNGDSTTYWTSRENNGTEAPYPAQLNVVTEAIPVPAGDVVLTGSSAICVYYVTFVPDAAPVQHTYTAAGNSDALFGESWKPALAANDLVLAEGDSLYRLEKANITLAAGKIEFKVCEDHAWTVAYPAQNYEFTIAEAGIYTIKITFNPETKAVAAEAIKTGEAVVIPTVAMHGNFSGSWKDTELFTLAQDSLTASLKINLAAGNYEFGMRIGGTGNWTANGANITRENPTTSLAEGSGNMHVTADQAGEYIFTYFFAEDSLAVTYPKLIPHYGVHEAIAAAADSVLVKDDQVYVRGIITKIEFKGKNFATYGSACIYVADASGAADTLEFYNCYSMNADTFKTSDPAYDATSTAWAQFNSVADANGVEIALGDTIEAFGKYNLFKGVHQLNQGCYLTVVNKYQPILGEPDYYLVGTMNEWQADSAYKFVKNEGAEGIEYKLTVALAENAELKVMGLVANDTLWYPDQADNYVVDAAHAGEAMDIYFRPNADGGNDWYHGVIFVPANVPELPEIALIGGMNGWDGNQGKFAPAADYKSAAWTINLDTLPADRGYAFKLLVDGIAMGSARDSAGNPFTFTPANNVLRPVDHVAVGDDEIFWLHMEDKVGEYTFIYTFADSSLKVVYPKVLPTTAPAAPTVAEDDVMALYCNHYATNNLDFTVQGWGGVGTWETLVIDSTNILACQDMKWEIMTNWGAESYDVSDYDKLHVDIWAPEAAKIAVTFEAQAGTKPKVSFDLVEGWNCIEAALTEWTDYDFKDMKYFILEGYSLEPAPLAFANVYFFKEAQGLNNTVDGVKAQKYIRNGMLLIEKNGKVYTITGQVVR